MALPGRRVGAESIVQDDGDGILFDGETETIWTISDCTVQCLRYTTGESILRLQFHLTDMCYAPIPADIVTSGSLAPLVAPRMCSQSRCAHVGCSEPIQSNILDHATLLLGVPEDK